MRILALSLVFSFLFYFPGCSEKKGELREEKPSLQGQPKLKVVKSFKRQFPQTLDGIYVFNDQLPSEMREEQYKFSAEHYVGCQKITRREARKIRKYNPNFIVLHYRLGIGLGYKTQGEWIEIIEGDEWVREWPSEEKIQDEWFFKWKGRRVLNTEWGYYLMELNNLSWRDYWTEEVLKQMKLNENDGLFADSFSVPNYLGGAAFAPSLPEIDEEFEESWSKRLEDFVGYVKKKFGKDFYLIPNVGSWINSRDRTNYQGADGVMVEGFAAEGEESFYEVSDWKLQMNRVLSLAKRDKILILQSYISEPENVNLRLFYLANYLLIKGKYSYVNIEYGFEPEYFPEYEIDLGKPEEGLPADIDELFNRRWGVYVRRYENGLVLVNPTANSKRVVFNRTYKVAEPKGGGNVPSSGDISSWVVEYRPVREVTLKPHQGAILLKQ